MNGASMAEISYTGTAGAGGQVTWFHVLTLKTVSFFRYWAAG